MADGRERMAYADLVRAVGAAENMAMIDVRRILDAATRILNEHTAAGGEVVVGRLGTFRGTVTENGNRLAFRRSTAASGPRGGDGED